MKKLLLLVGIMLCGLMANADTYYLNLINSSTKYYFVYNETDGYYYTTVPVLNSDYKVYNSLYDSDPTNNDYIYGAADGQSYGMSPGDTKDLAHPGNNLSVEGGGILYNVTFKFSPTAMTLEMTAGSRDENDADNPVLVPMLVGQYYVDDTVYNWDPSVVIDPETDSSTGYYVFQVQFAESGQFSFITTKGTSSTDWDTVNSTVRYAPSSNTTVVFNTWMPYDEFSGSTENRWELPDDAAKADGTWYVVYFDQQNTRIMVLGETHTAVKSVAAEPESSEVDVYTMTGVRVSHYADRSSAIASLPSGMYIIGKEKVLVR